MPREPISQFYYSHRLKLHFWDWGNNGKPNLILVHGGMDHARSWDRIAEAFLDDFRVIAPDPADTETATGLGERCIV